MIHIKNNEVYEIKRINTLAINILSNINVDNFIAKENLKLNQKRIELPYVITRIR